MAIHAPAHRPAYHFHLALPHVDGSATGIVMLVVGVAVMLAITWGAYARAATPSTVTTEGYSAAMTAEAYDGSAAIQALQVRQAGPLGPEAQSLLRFRAGERMLTDPEAAALLLFRAGEREPLSVTEAQSLLDFRAGERASQSGSEAESLLLFRAGEREGR